MSQWRLSHYEKLSISIQVLAKLHLLICNMVIFHLLMCKITWENCWRIWMKFLKLLEYRTHTSWLDSEHSTRVEEATGLLLLYPLCTVMPFDMDLIWRSKPPWDATVFTGVKHQTQPSELPNFWMIFDELCLFHNVVYCHMHQVLTLWNLLVFCSLICRGVAGRGVQGSGPPLRSPGRLLWIMQIRWENFHVPPPTPTAPHEIWSVDSQENVWNCYPQMSDFKAKMHQIRFRLGLRPRPRWGSLQRSPRPPSWI